MIKTFIKQNEMLQICVIIFVFLKVDRMQFQHHIKSKHSNVRLLVIQMPVLRHLSHDLELHVLSNSQILLYVKSRK